jgi:hypothetical protein
MRTSTLSNTSRGEVVSLSDVTAAIANAAKPNGTHARDPKRLPTLSLASSLKPVGVVPEEPR